ncbi:MAG: hypothetical protein ACI9AB_001052 [Urechidicola sp.]|jgi:hypothetical protein
MDTQILLEEAKIISQKVVTKEIITDESMIFGGVTDSIEIIGMDGMEYKRKSSFLDKSSTPSLG